MQTFNKIYRVFAFIMFIISIIAWMYFIYEYILLYFLVYPLGGIVMVQSYLFLKEKFAPKTKKKKVSLNWLKDLSFLFLVFSIIAIVLNLLIV